MLPTKHNFLSLSTFIKSGLVMSSNTGTNRPPLSTRGRCRSFFFSPHRCCRLLPNSIHKEKEDRDCCISTRWYPDCKWLPFSPSFAVDYVIWWASDVLHLVSNVASTVVYFYYFTTTCHIYIIQKTSYGAFSSESFMGFELSGKKMNAMWLSHMFCKWKHYIPTVEKKSKRNR